MTDDQLLLANAYVDHELDAAERARAEADAEVMAEVARLRIATSALRDVEPPDEARREAAIAAALRTSGRPTPVAPPVPLRPRSRWWPATGIAAAVVAIVLGGAVVLRTTSGGDDDDSASIQQAAQPESAATDASRSAADAEAPTGAGATTAASATTAAGGSATTGPPELAAVPTTTIPTRPAAPQTDAGAALTVIASRDDLIAFAMEATPQTPPPDVCPGGQFVAPATYTGVSPPVSVEVFVVGPDAVARDATSCVEVLRAALP